MKKSLLVFLIIFLVGLGLYLWRYGPGNMPHISGGPHMMPNTRPEPSTSQALVIPAILSEKAETGKTLFNANCVVCHGQNATGNTGKGPPLVHYIYEPSHHADEAFQRAVASGVIAHHWPFGNMPPIPSLTRQDVEDIVSYVRELQRANGIK